MTMGAIVKERMAMLGMDFSSLVYDTMLEESLVQDILDDNITFKDIDSFDVDVLASALFCSPEYFYSDQARSKDVVFCSQNRGGDTVKSNLEKAKIQAFMRDYIYIKSITR